MAKTLSNLEVETRMYLDEAAQLDWLQTEVDLAINRAYHDVISKVIEIYEMFYETVTPFTYAMVKSQQEYVIDSSLIKVTRVEINYNPSATNSLPIRCVPISADELRRNLANTNSAGSFFNASYYLHGNIGVQQIGFVPIPTTESDTGNTKSISVWGIAMPTDLVNGTDNVNIPYADLYAYLISLRAAAQLLRKGQQEENAAARYIQEYNVGVIGMMTFLKERKADDVWAIEDATLEDIDFTTSPIV